MRQTVLSPVRNVGFVCGRLKPLLDVGASQVGQRAPLLEPSVHTHLDVTVDVPANESISVLLWLSSITLY